MEYQEDELLSDEELMEQEAAAEAAKTAEAERMLRLDALGVSLAKSRSEAIDGRQQSGIEDEWLEDEEYYEGIDDANRGEMKAWAGKPLGKAALPSDEQSGSTVFINITQQYCDSVAARIGDMLLPTDDSAFQVGPTPIPEMEPLITKGQLPKEVKNQISAAFPGRPEAAAAEERRIIAQAQESAQQAKQKADRAQVRIEDWHVECQYHAAVRQVIEDCCKIGSGVLKGPVPRKVRSIAYLNGALVIKEEIKPASLRIDPRNLYPDPGCGTNIHNGSFLWEKDDITRKQLEALKGTPGYIESQIDKVLLEGPHKATRAVPERSDVNGLVPRETKNLFEIWYGFCQLEKDDLIAAGYKCDPDKVPPTVHAQITMINNTVIGATMNPLDTGGFPYDVMVIKRRMGMPWGIGISRQVRTPQRIVNGAARNMMDNAGIAGGPMWMYLSGIVEPLDGIYELRPRKGWRASEGVEQASLDKAFQFLNIDMRQSELQAIIFLGMKLAEDVVGLPMIMQGQMGQTTPDRVGVVEILNQNASTVLRRIARLFDDLLTEPHIRRYYAYLMQYGDDAEKGDFQIDARGSSALVERAIESQEIMGMATMVGNPIFGLDPKKWANEWLKSKRLDPKRFEYDDEEWQQVVQQMSQPAADPRLEVAQMNADTKMQIEKFKAEYGSAESQKNREFEAWKVQTGQQFEGALAEFEAQWERDLEERKHAGEKDVNLDTIKSNMANNIMKLKTQLKLSGSKESPQVATPAMEPKGRAPDGQAFQR